MGKTQLVPIQEDETALVIWALWEHYDRYRDIEFIRRLYRPLILLCADFMLEFIGGKSDCQKRVGICGKIGAEFTLLLAERWLADFVRRLILPIFLAKWNAANFTKKRQTEMVEAIRKHLFSNELGRFLRAIETQR